MLHHLTLTRSLYSHASGKTLTQTEQSLDAKSKRVSFTFPESVPADSKVDLKVAFKGELGDGMTGYYKASYTPDGETKHYALTQFEVRLKFMVSYNVS